MADSTFVEASPQDLTDDQIQQLLLEAETRLRGPNAVAPVDDLASIRIPKLSTGSSLEAYVQQGDDAATVNATKIADPTQKKLANSLHAVGKKENKEKPNAGPAWFNLPKTEMTAELKRDLQLIRMRSVLDPHRHYKKDNGKANPLSPTEFFSNRITKKDRKRNFVEETLALERGTKRFEKKYRDIQTAKTSGKKSFYKNLQAKRRRNNK
ncbi:Fcf2 pre-rRNA processing [Penicillium brevicompactum]|uniref:Fcf2 pre-rRNA processing n=1 Tax=Penicillium brevicompactum TaxID=5074 RepID=A0A9W9RLP9_PENBR|nr:Fcf2 pre-rRNA processing [Penicillium brevicompactum]